MHGVHQQAMQKGMVDAAGSGAVADFFLIGLQEPDGQRLVGGVLDLSDHRFQLVHIAVCVDRSGRNDVLRIGLFGRFDVHQDHVLGVLEAGDGSADLDRGTGLDVVVFVTVIPEFEADRTGIVGQCAGQVPGIVFLGQKDLAGFQKVNTFDDLCAGGHISNRFMFHLLSLAFL